MMLSAAVGVSGATAESVERAELRVLAAASLADAMAEVATAWAASGGVRIQLQLGGSNDLLRQIEAGAPADLFVSADAAKIDRLEALGLLAPGTRRDLLSNRLVVIAPDHGDWPAAGALGLAEPAVRRIALAQPEAVPAGIYARQWLERIGLWQRVREKIVATDNVRSALALVAAGNADAGVVYSTDAAASDRVRVVYEVPGAEGPRIVYPVAVLADAPNPDAARRFTEFLAGTEARRVFERHGFSRPQ